MQAAHLRILDANANRAREALRVMEDIARFVLDDADLSGGIKALRHELHAVLDDARIDAASLLAWRDTPGDVGTSIGTDAEYTRGGLSHVAAAACKRLTEALRSIEECLKIPVDFRTPATTGMGDSELTRTAAQHTATHPPSSLSTIPAVSQAAGALVVSSPATPPASPPARIEAMRYAAYEIERRLMVALPAAGGSDTPARQWRLCVVITESLCEHDAWENVARACIAGGADCLQLREKDLEGGELLRRARILVEIAREEARRAAAGGSTRVRGNNASQRPHSESGDTQNHHSESGASNPHSESGATRDFRCSIIINDRPDIALLAGADGVHLGQSDLPIREVRKLAGSSLLVGVSTGSIEQARQAAREGADYIGVGPMFPTTTKHKPVIAGPAYLAQVLADPVTRRLPHLAIGGITPENVGELSRVGCRGVAVSSAVQKRQRPAVACQALLDGLASTH